MGEFTAFQIDSVFIWQSWANGEGRNWRSTKILRKRPCREGQGRSPLTISVSLLKTGPLAQEPAAPQAAALVLVRLAMNQLIDQTVGIQATLRGPPTRLTCIRLYQVPCAQSCLTLCYPMDCSLSDSSVYRILQARIPQWFAISSSRASSQPRGHTPISCISCIAGIILPAEAILGSL